MKLSQLVLEGDKKYEKDNDVIPVLWQTHHIVEIFMHFLPKILLDGSSKVVIFFKEKAENEEQYVCDNYFHVSWYYVEKHKLNEKELLTRAQFESYYLRIIVDTLTKIAEKSGNFDIIEDIKKAAKDVEISKFVLTYKITKLCKISPCKLYRANVFRHLDDNGEMWFVEIIRKDKQVVKQNIMDKPSHITKVDFFNKAEWDGTSFILRNRFEQVITNINANTLFKNI